MNNSSANTKIDPGKDSLGKKERMRAWHEIKMPKISSEGLGNKKKITAKKRKRENKSKRSGKKQMTALNKIKKIKDKTGKAPYLISNELSRCLIVISCPSFGAVI